MIKKVGKKVNLLEHLYFISGGAKALLLKYSATKVDIW